jgi:hypothetical protein
MLAQITIEGDTFKQNIFFSTKNSNFLTNSKDKKIEDVFLALEPWILRLPLLP